MNKWLERFENHPVHNQIETFEEKLYETERIIHQGIDDPATIESLDRLKMAQNSVKVKIENTDPLLVPIQTLKQLNGAISQINPELTNFINNHNPEHLSNANSHVDTISLHLSNILSPQSKEEVEGIKDSIVSFRRSAGQYIKYLEVEYNGLVDKIKGISAQASDINEEINSQKGRLDQAISQFQQQFSDAEDRRREQFEKAKEKRKEDYDQLISEIEEQFANETNEIKEEFSSVLNDIKTQSTSINEELNQNAETLLNKIEKEKSKASEIVTIITNSGMVGGYQEIANQEKKSAKIWQIIATSSLVFLIGFAIFTFAATFSGELHWGKIGARIFVAASFGLLAAYAARQADKHEIAERKNRKMELELAAIDPYLSELPEDKKHCIKEELASRLFAQHDDLNESVANGKTTGSITDILQMALESINTLSKKTGS